MFLLTYPQTVCILKVVHVVPVYVCLFFMLLNCIDADELDIMVTSNLSINNQ
eukprot:UN00501